MGSDIDEVTAKVLNSGAHLMEALKQGRYEPIADWQQALLLFAVSEGFSDHIETEKMAQFEKELFVYMQENCTDIVEVLRTGAKADGELLGKIREAVSTFKERF